MSEYKKIHGIHVQALASDPSNLGAGQVWYNTTTNKLKITAVSTTGTWATGGNLGTSRRYLAGCGTQTAGLAFGGTSDGSTALNVTEHYDGSAWTSGGNMATARYKLAGAGTQTSGLAFGGYANNATEHYDGSAWTAGGNLGTGRYAIAGAGTLSAGLGFGGYDGSSAVVNATEEYAGPGITTQTGTTS